MPLTQRCWEGEGLRRYAICVAPHCLQYTSRGWARYHATRSPERRCTYHLLAITSLPARKGVEISEGGAPDNNAAPPVEPLYHSLKSCPVASLEDCSRTDLSTHQSGEQPKCKLAGSFVARRRRLYNPYDWKLIRIQFGCVDKQAVLNGFISRLCVSPSYDATSDSYLQVFVRRRYLFSTTFPSFCTTRMDKASQSMNVSCWMRTVRREARALASRRQCDRQQDVALLDAPFARTKKKTIERIMKRTK